MNAESAESLAARRRVLRAALAGAGALLTLRTVGATAPPIPASSAGSPNQAAERREKAAAHFPFGPVSPPRAIEALPVITDRGMPTDLAAMLRGRVTALQLMFTGCSATCPIQGALFAQAQQALPGLWRRPQDAVPAQWLSLSIDPLSDGPAQLAAWLRQFDGGPLWRAAAPRLGDVERLIALLGSGGESRPRGADPHTGQVYIVNRQGELAHRTQSMPVPAQIVEALRRVEASS